VLKQYKNNETTHNIVCVTNLNEMRLHTIHAAAYYGSSNNPETNPSSQARPTISQCMQTGFQLGIKNRCSKIHL
jgi:hypothetical protein